MGECPIVEEDSTLALDALDAERSSPGACTVPCLNTPPLPLSPSKLKYQQMHLPHVRIANGGTLAAIPSGNLSLTRVNFFRKSQNISKGPTWFERSDPYLRMLLWCKVMSI